MLTIFNKLRKDTNVSTELRLLNKNDGHDVYNMLQHIIPSDDKFNNEMYGKSYEEYKEWLVLHTKWAKGEELPDGYVKELFYWLYVDNTPVGFGKIREKLTEQSRQFGGTIGYAISSEYRNRGYGNILCEELVKIAKAKGYEILVTVEKCNIPSRRIAENAGLKLINENDKRWYFTERKISNG